MTEKIKLYDDSFNEDLFISKVDRIFMMILDSIMHRNPKIVDHYVSDNVYKKIANLSSDYKEKKIIRLFDESNIKSTNIVDFEFKNNNLFIIVELISRYMDYFIDEETGNYIRGINTHRIEKKHKIILIKKYNSKQLGITTNCPKCGNSLNTNVSGICSYCKNVIDMYEYDYIISDISI